MLEYYANRASWLINTMFHIKDDPFRGLHRLHTFIYASFKKTRLPPQLVVLIVALLVRLKSNFPNACRSSEAAGHRLFLAAFMISFKTCIDDSFSNSSIVSLCNGVFGLSQINAMEKELLGLLDWQVHFNDYELAQWVVWTASRSLLTSHRTQSLFGDPPSYQQSMDREMDRLSIRKTSKPVSVELKSKFSSPSSASACSASASASASASRSTSRSASISRYSSPETYQHYHPYPVNMCKPI